ncbi:MAG: Flp pilus assembly protein TadG, partial [Hyphomicrobiaceae bacterium]
QNFAADRKGTVAMIFAGAFVPIVAVAGISVDYSRAQRIQTIMQVAADAASIAAATASAPTTAQRITIATDVFNANAKLSRFNLTATPTVNVQTGSVEVSVDVNVPTTFMKIVAINEVPVRVTSQVTTAGKTLELSLVLDVTGSMGNGTGSKLADMKWAAKDLMDIVMPVGGGNSPTKIALVPFSDRVNVGTLAATVTGLPNTRQFQSNRWPYNTYTKYLRTCVTERQGSYRYEDDAPGSNKYVGRYNPYYYSTSSRQYSNSQNYCSRPEIKSLSSDRTMLRNHIDSFVGSGGTAGHIGTAWGMYTLSPKWNAIWTTNTPLAYDEDTNIKAVVIMTDGDYNTDYTSNMNSTQQALALCEEMKSQNKGIVVYTVGFAIPEGSS